MHDDPVTYENIITLTQELYYLQQYNLPEYSGDDVKTHFHFMYELMWFDRSCGYFGINDRRIPIKNGTLIFVPALIPHAMYLTPEYNHNRYLFQFEFDFLNPLAISHFSRKKDRIRVLYPDPATGVQLTALFDWTISLGKKPDHQAVFLKSIALLMEFVFSLNHNDETFPHAPGSDFVSRVRQLLYEIEEHKAWETTALEAAHRCQVSKSYFSRMFKRLFNMTFKEYIFLRKLKVAVQLLTSSQLKIVDVAQTAGFTDSAYFCLRFRQHLGCTPLEFRDRLDNRHVG